MPFCVIHGPIPDGEVGYQAPCGQVHNSASGVHTLNGDPCYPIVIPGIEGVIAPAEPTVDMQGRGIALQGGDEGQPGGGQL